MGVTDIETVQEYVENSYGDETCRAAALESISRVSVQIKNITAQVAELGKSLKLAQSHA